MLFQCAIMSKITLNITLHGSNCIDYEDIKLAYDKHQCTNQLLCMAEINCSKNCISQIIPMCHYVKNHIKYNITWL